MVAEANGRFPTYGLIMRSTQKVHSRGLFLLVTAV